MKKINYEINLTFLIVLLLFNSCTRSDSNNVNETNVKQAEDPTLKLKAKLEQDFVNCKLIEPFGNIEDEMESTPYFDNINDFKQQRPDEYKIYKSLANGDQWSIKSSIVRANTENIVNVKRFDNLDTTAMVLVFKNGNLDFNNDYFIDVYNHTNERMEDDSLGSQVIISYILGGRNLSYNFSSLNSPDKVNRISYKLNSITRTKCFIFLETIYYKRPEWIKDPNESTGESGQFKSGDLFLKAYYYNSKNNSINRYYVRVGNGFVEFGELEDSLYQNVSTAIFDVIKKTLGLD